MCVLVGYIGEGLKVCSMCILCVQVYIRGGGCILVCVGVYWLCV